MIKCIFSGWINQYIGLEGTTAAHVLPLNIQTGTLFVFVFRQGSETVAWETMMSQGGQEQVACDVVFRPSIRYRMATISDFVFKIKLNNFRTLWSYTYLFSCSENIWFLGWSHRHIGWNENSGNDTWFQSVWIEFMLYTEQRFCFCQLHNDSCLDGENNTVLVLCRLTNQRKERNAVAGGPASSTAATSILLSFGPKNRIHNIISRRDILDVNGDSMQFPLQADFSHVYV